MSLIIQSLTLSSFMCYKSLELEFKSNNVISGHNGSGKSTIIHAISLGLFNSYPNSLKELIRHGETTSTVVIKFLCKNTEYQITRIFGNKSLTELVCNEETITGNKECYRYLAVLFGDINLSSIYQYLFINPSNITWMFLLEPSKRKVLFNDAMGLDKYEKIWDQLRGSQKLLIKYQQQIDKQVQFELGRKKSIIEERENLTFFKDSLDKLIIKQKLFDNNKDSIEKLVRLKDDIVNCNIAISKLRSKISKELSKLKQAKDNKCYACGQSIKNPEDIVKELEGVIFEYETKLSNLLDREEELKLEYNSIDSGLDSNLKDYSRNIVSLEENIKRIKNLSFDDSILQELKQDKVKVDNKLELLKFIRDGIKQIPPLIVKSMNENISVEASKILSEIMETAVDVIIDENYNVNVGINDDVLQFYQLSSGQQVMAAIAIRLATIKYISGDLNIVFLDEPTVNLDTERKQRLSYILSNVGFNQTFVISHDDVFNNYDNVVNVEEL